MPHNRGEGLSFPEKAEGGRIATPGFLQPYPFEGPKAKNVKKVQAGAAAFQSSTMPL
jgi:hypothetical protein